MSITPYLYYLVFTYFLTSLLLLRIKLPQFYITQITMISLQKYFNLFQPKILIDMKIQIYYLICIMYRKEKMSLDDQLYLVMNQISIYPRLNVYQVIIILLLESMLNLQNILLDVLRQIKSFQLLILYLVMSIQSLKMLSELLMLIIRLSKLILETIELGMVQVRLMKWIVIYNTHYSILNKP